jgi:hypothetical protein
MARLTDTQLIVLSKAAARDDGIASIPGGLNKAAAAKLGASLVSRKLMREVRSKPDMPVWREKDAIEEGRDDLGGAGRRHWLAASHHTRGADRPSQTRIYRAARAPGRQAIAISHRL